MNQAGRLVAFYNEKMYEAKQKYSSYDLEFYALVQALRKWRHYLLPKEFVVFIDNQGLSFINSQEKLSNRHIKWIEYLQAYTFTIKHKKGQLNKVADVLSKRLLIVQEVTLQSIGVESFKELYKEDEYFSEVYKVCSKFNNHFNSQYVDYTLQSGLLFKGC